MLGAPYLLVDGSVNPKTRIGFGAYCLVDASAREQPQAGIIHTQRFDDTSSTHLEINALLWAVQHCGVHAPLAIFTDCQNIVQLPQRRQRLEANDYNNSKGQPLALAERYQAFFQQQDHLGFTLHKIKGHQPSQGKTPLEKIFATVDQAARQAGRASARRGSK